MLGDVSAHATLPVSDLDEAAKFYEGILGLEDMGERDGGTAVMYRAGTTYIVLYESEFAGTNQATSILWEVEDPEELVEELKEKGVEFEHYPELPGTVLEGDIHRKGPMLVAWFKDPDGNIHCIGDSL